MRGTVLDVDADGGLILGVDDRRYRFTASDWKGEAPPRRWEPVDFLPQGEVAASVYPLPAASAAPSAPSRAPVSADDLTQNAGALSLAAAASGLIGLLPGLGLPFSVIGVVLGLIAAARARDDGDDASLLRARIGYIAGGVMLAGYALALLAGLFLLGGLAAAFGWL